MAQPTVIAWDLLLTGNVSFRSVELPAGVVGNTEFSSATADRLATTKQVHKHHKHHAQPNTTATTETRTLHVVRGQTGTIVSFFAGSIAACAGAATITVDLRKNGTTVLSSILTLDNANTARIVELATVSTPGLVANDWLEIVITATAGGGTLGTGLYVGLIVDEDPA